MINLEGISSDPATTLADMFIQRALSFQRNRDANLQLLVRFGDEAVWVSIQNGKVTQATRDIRPLTSHDVSISAAPEVWQRFWENTPAAGSHDIFALTKRGEMQIQGNLQPFMAHLQFVKDLLAVGRGDKK